MIGLRDAAAMPAAAVHEVRRRLAPQALDGRVAAVTGAGSGIGRGVAQALAEAGCRLALGDISAERLASAAAGLPVGTEVVTTAVDVSDRAAMHGWAEATAAHFGGVDIMVNNAGIAHLATVSGTTYEDLERIIDVNLMGAVHGTKAFLPHLVASPAAHLVNIASIFGVIAVPTQSAYNVSKFAVRGFTEALAQEMDLLGTGVQVHLVLPGGVATSIARDASAGDVEGVVDAEQVRRAFDRLARTTPQEAGRIIVRGVRRGDRRILVGPDAVLLDLMARLLPSSYQSLVVRAIR